MHTKDTDTAENEWTYTDCITYITYVHSAKSMNLSRMTDLTIISKTFLGFGFEMLMHVQL